MPTTLTTYVFCAVGLMTEPNADLVRLRPALHPEQKNVKATYLDNIWSVINWKKAEERLTSA